MEFKTRRKIHVLKSPKSTPTLQIFFHVMMAHPEIQKRAQAQLDAVVGPDRLPTLNDRDQLPYIDAILKEVTRSAPVTPLGEYI